MRTMDDFAEEERTAVIRLLRNAIDADRFAHSDRVRTWKAALAKLDPASAPKPIMERPPLQSVPRAARPRGTRRR
jgi:hypothetical protein